MAAIGAFAVTNVDDLVVITTLFTTSYTTTGPRPAVIIAGRYVGFAALVACSILGAMGLFAVPGPWVGLLGVIPLGLGLRALWRSPNRQQHPDHAATNVVSILGLVGVAAVTFANGGDNIAIYIPLLRRADAAGAALIVVIFAALVAVWCVAGAGLGRHPIVLGVIERVGHLLVPIVFIAVGS